MLCYFQLVVPISTFPSRTSWCYVPHRRWLALRKSENEEPRRGASTRRGVGCEDEYKRAPEDYLIMTLYVWFMYTYIMVSMYIYVYVDIFVVDVCSWFMYIYYIYMIYTYSIQYTSTKSIYIYTHVTCVYFSNYGLGQKTGVPACYVLKATIMVRKSWSFEATSLGQWVNWALRLKECFYARSWLRMSEDMEWEDLTKYVNRCSRMMDCKWKTSHRWRIQD